ncbi:MAG: glycosyltransferase family 4 protein, partial [Chloroflexi bacterium]|nr:glycosyltransferase family 4 protein [Chloroflexota bacterium]
MLSSAMGGGGGEVYALRLARALRARGHQVTFACRRKSWIQGASIESGFPVLTVAPRNSGDIVSSVRMAAALRAEPYDVLHAHVGRDYLPAVAAGRLASRPVVLTRHTVFPMSGISARATSTASRVIAVSGAVRQALVELCHIPEARISVIPTGVDIDRFNPSGRPSVRPWFQDEKDSFVFGVMNELHKGKRCDVFLRAGASVARRHPQVRFVLIGEGPAREALEQLAVELGINEKVIFTGYLDQVWTLLPALDVLISASNTEGFNMALAEGMACGLPLIATDLPAHQELVVEGESGWLFPVDDQAALEEKMDRLASDPDLARRMGEC